MELREQGWGIWLQLDDQGLGLAIGLAAVASSKVALESLGFLGKSSIQG